MPEITDADREAAVALRVILADISGFWFQGDDDSPLCAALARHRAEAEQRIVAKLGVLEPRAERRQPDCRPGRDIASPFVREKGFEDAGLAA